MLGASLSVVRATAPRCFHAFCAGICAVPSRWRCSMVLCAHDLDEQVNLILHSGGGEDATLLRRSVVCAHALPLAVVDRRCSACVCVEQSCIRVDGCLYLLHPLSPRSKVMSPPCLGALVFVRRTVDERRVNPRLRFLWPELGKHTKPPRFIIEPDAEVCAHLNNAVTHADGDGASRLLRCPGAPSESLSTFQLYKNSCKVERL